MPAEEALKAWVLGLLEAISIPKDACLWMGWNAFDIRLPAPWRDDGEGPLDKRWSEIRLFHRRLEIRVQRTPVLIRLRLLTEEEPVRTSALQHGREHMTQSLVVSCPEPYRTLPGRILLAGRSLTFGGVTPEGTLGEIQYPRLLSYLGHDGPPRIDERAGRVPVQVVRYFDHIYRLRAVRYRSWEA